MPLQRGGRRSWGRRARAANANMTRPALRPVSARPTAAGGYGEPAGMPQIQTRLGFSGRPSVAAQICANTFTRLRAPTPRRSARLSTSLTW